MAARRARSSFDPELGNFVEEICADLCRFESATRVGCAPGDVWVERDVPLGDGYADLRVQPPGGAPSFVENKLAYSAADVVARVRSKYGKTDLAASGLSVVLDRATLAGAADVDAALRGAVAAGLTLDVWDVNDLFARLKSTFGCEIDDVSHGSLRDVRSAIERAHWRLAFGADFAAYPASSTLLWHFSHWELERLHREEGLVPGQVLEPRLYDGVIVVMADLCSFSSYVRDTRDAEQIRRRLTEFYSLARHAVLNAGGMFYQFVGDEVVALFGLHEPPETAATRALRCVRSLFDAGNSVSQAWQRSLDRVQPSGGVHVGIAMGDLHLLPLRPFSQSHIGFIGDGLNVTARLMGEAKSREAIVSNMVYRRLGTELQQVFEDVGPIEAKNVGRIHGWRLTQATLAGADLGR